MHTIQELFKEGYYRLKDLPNPHLEAKLLLLRAASLSEIQFFTFPNKRIPKAQAREYYKLISKRLTGIPLAYLTGKKEFWSIPFKVVPGIFIPRPETELIVEKVLELSSGKKETIVDIGTGCGNLAISLAKELPQARIVATDTATKALKLARLNASAQKIKNITFAQGSLFSPLKKLQLTGRCDFIISNPPYIPQKEWETLGREIQNFEPIYAFLAGEDGLEIIKKLIQGALVFLKPGGYLLLEYGYSQKKEILSHFGLDSDWIDVNFYKDLSRTYRVVSGKKKRIMGEMS